MTDGSLRALAVLRRLSAHVCSGEGASQLLRVDDGGCVASGPAALGLHRLLHLMALLGVGGVEGQRLRRCDGVHSRPFISPTPVARLSG